MDGTGSDSFISLLANKAHERSQKELSPELFLCIFQQNLPPKKTKPCFYPCPCEIRKKIQKKSPAPTAPRDRGPPSFDLARWPPGGARSGPRGRTLAAPARRAARGTGTFYASRNWRRDVASVGIFSLAQGDVCMSIGHFVICLFVSL